MKDAGSTFFGGEALLKASLKFEILQAARHLERETGVPATAKVSTNGVLLDDGLRQIEIVRYLGVVALA